MCVIQTLLICNICAFFFVIFLGDCSDTYNTKDCKIWAEFGHCDKNPSFMLLNCKRSCKVCSGSGGNDGNSGGTDGTKDTGVDKGERPVLPDGNFYYLSGCFLLFDILNCFTQIR